MKISRIHSFALIGLIALPFVRSTVGDDARDCFPIPDRALERLLDCAAERSPEPEGEFAGRWEKRASYLRGRIFHSAVWTYAEMIVWGGGSEHQFYNDGGIYDPIKDTWKPLSLENAPPGRWCHAAVWTGSEMIVWGGRSSFAPAASWPGPMRVLNSATAV